MKWIVLIILVLLFLLFVPIKLKSKVIYNFLRNNGYISFYFYNLKLMVTNWKFALFKVIIKGKKDVSIYFDDLKNQTNFGDIFFSQLFKTVKINNFRTFANFGVAGNCLISSLGCGGIAVLNGIFVSYFINKKPSYKSSSQIFPDYEANTFILCFTTSVQLNLFKVLNCFVLSLIIKFNKGE